MAKKKLICALLKYSPISEYFLFIFIALYIFQNRAKISTKRRPPSRRARISKISENYTVPKDDADGSEENDDIAEVPRISESSTVEIVPTPRDLEVPETKIPVASVNKETFDDILLGNKVKKSTKIEDLFGDSEEESADSFGSVTKNTVVAAGANAVESQRPIAVIGTCFVLSIFIIFVYDTMTHVL